MELTLDSTIKYFNLLMINIKQHKMENIKSLIRSLIEKQLHAPSALRFLNTEAHRVTKMS